MVVVHLTQPVATTVAGFVLSPLGISLFGAFGLFGIFGSIILILLVANLVGGRSRSHGDPSGLGIALGFGLFFILTVAIDAALG